MKIIKVQYGSDIPDNFTGIVEYEDEYKKEWYKDGKLHREDGPALDYNGYKEWWIDNCGYHKETLEDLIELCIFLGKEKGKHGLVWLKFLYEDEIKEFPIVPGMETDEEFKQVFEI